MPKLKTHSGAKKRFKKTASGKIKRSKTNGGHFMLRKSNSRLRRLQQSAYVDDGVQHRIDRMLPYG